MGFVELHCRSAFSFLRGGSAPEAMANTAAALDLPGMALCDRNGVQGAVRFHMTAKEAGLKPYVGCELWMEDESVVPVLVPTQASYRRLCDLLTGSLLSAEKGEGRIRWQDLEDNNAGLIALTGDEEGPVRRAWRTQGAKQAGEAGNRLKRIFGEGRLFVELQRHLLPEEDEENEFLADWAASAGLPLLATNGASYALPEHRNVADVFICLREHTTLDGAGRKLARNRERQVKSPAQMAELFSDMPEAIANSERLAAQLGFTLDELGYRFPDYPTPGGIEQIQHLRDVTYAGAVERYGTLTPAVRKQLERELDLIGRLGFSGYFLIVWDLCRFTRSRGTLVQGRGSAANSAVCYSLGITAVDPVGGKLLFERFLSEGRKDWPDIDLDFPSEERREEVIQEVYRRYGRRGTALTANVITFQAKKTAREVGKVFGISDDVLDRFSSLFHSGDYRQTLEIREQLKQAGIAAEHPRLPFLLETCLQVYGLPSHLGQHSGGMVLSSGELSQFVPIENARMSNRSVIQWDKTDCEEMGLIKIDLLGLGMMAVLQDTIEICSQRGEPVDLAKLPYDDAKVYDAICAADTVGVFQIESRAQMATLPRMLPRTFYDLAIEVALIRPGPIQGNATNPYLDRRQNKAPVVYLDERLKPILERTLGIVLFQEQILRIAMELAGFTAGEADELRRAIGFTRSKERMNKMEAKLHAALLKHGATEQAAKSICESLASFALYGFPESHAISFALIAYASAWLKVHRPAAFHASLLNNQPMGFYSRASLVQDARRHGVRSLPVCVVTSDQLSRVIDKGSVRLGFNCVKGLSAKPVEGMLAERAERPFASMQDFLKRTAFNPRERRLLARCGALNRLGEHRRASLWQVEATHEEDLLFRHSRHEEEARLSPLERMTQLERLQADYATLELTTGTHPMGLVRERLPGLWAASELKEAANGARIRVGGSVITRQRPGTAKGFCFITLEDETGHTNAIVRPQLFEERRMVINMEPALIIGGRVQNERGVIHIMAEEITALPPLGLPEGASHDYH
jgi:error-prone DNA polymerase